MNNTMSSLKGYVHVLPHDFPALQNHVIALLREPYFWYCSILLYVVYFVAGLFIVPAKLRHLPRVPILPLLWSYLSAEVEDVRIRRLILPYANEHGEGLVLVWALGRWMIHILDHKLAQQMSDHVSEFPKELPPDDLLLWRFIGRSNILLANDALWRKHSTLIHDAFSLALPIDYFTTLCRHLFDVIGSNSTVKFDDLAQRFALDAVGSTVLGHDFDAIRTDSEFVKEYNGIMHSIANPLYLIMPFLERVFPRKKVIKRMDLLAEKFMTLLQAKRTDPGDDMMTFMLKDPNMTDVELRDNMVVLFIAGHDTSAGGLSTMMYYLAKHPELQAALHEEVMSTLGPTADPTAASLAPATLPLLNACIREALRINTPISYIVPRAPKRDTHLGRYAIPAGTSLIMNIYAVHHNETTYPDAHSFQPERFLGKDQAGKRESEWLPFALGPRQCPARNFALYEQRALAVMLLREYEWSLPENTIHKDGLKNAFSPFALTLPYDLDLTFKKRKI